MRKRLHSLSLKPLHHKTRRAIRLPVLIKPTIRVVRVARPPQHRDTGRHLEVWWVGASAVTACAGRCRPGSRRGTGAVAQGAIAGDAFVVCLAGGVVGVVESCGHADAGETALFASPAWWWAVHVHCEGDLREKVEEWLEWFVWVTVKRSMMRYLHDLQVGPVCGKGSRSISVDYRSFENSLITILEYWCLAVKPGEEIDVL